MKSHIPTQVRNRKSPRDGENCYWANPNLGFAPEGACAGAKPLGRRQRRHRRPWLLLAVCGSLLGLHVANGASFRWSATANRIYVEGGGVATLSGIKAALPTAPLDLVDSANRIWLLRADVSVQDGTTLVLHGASVGGDVNEFRLQSVNSATPCTCVVSITADWGALDIHSTKITSWDTTTGAPDTNYVSNGRAYIRVRSSLSTNGVTPLESRMDITNSEICYLGSDDSEAYGLTWKVVTDTNQGNAIFDKVNVYGNVVGSYLHDNYYGAYTFGAYGMQWLTNEIAHNVEYGLQPHDDSDNFLIQGNNVHHNGSHGIMATMRCDHLTLRGNLCWSNVENGIVLNRHSDQGLVEGNRCFANGDNGVALTACFNTTLRANQLWGNATAGLRLDLGSADNVITSNDCASNALYGFYFVKGGATPEAGDDGRPKRNQFLSNTVHDNDGEAIRLSDSDNNVFGTNVFTANGPKLRFQRGTGNWLDNNILPSDCAAHTEGDVGTNASTYVRNQTYLKVELGTNSTTVFQDAQGRIYEPDEAAILSQISSSGSTLTLSPAAAGSSTTVIARNFLVGVSSGSAFINNVAWDPSARTEWTAMAGTTGQNLNFILGDLIPTTSYHILKDGVVFTNLTTEAAGRLQFSDTATTTNAVVYAVEIPPTNTITFRYSPSVNRIYLENGGAASLSDIKAALPNAPLDLVDPANKIWLLRADLLVDDGSTLFIHGDSAGGDVNQLRLLSLNSTNTNSVVSITADWGNLDVNGTKITSWDTAVNGPDTNSAAFGRAFIRARSTLSTNGTPQESRMDLHNSEIAYLGSDNSEAYGLVWKVAGTNASSTNSIFSLVKVSGDVVNCKIHHNYMGGYTYGAKGMQWMTTEIYNNASYGLDLQSESDNLTIQANNVHDNGNHGVFASGHCDHLSLVSNITGSNDGNGILLDDGCTDALLANNYSAANADSGIAIVASSRNVMRSNNLTQNQRAGLRLNLGSADNQVTQNLCVSNTLYGIYSYIGSGTPAPGDNGRPKRNSLTANQFQGNGVEPVRVADSDDNTLSGNTFTDTSGKLRFQRALRNWLDGNVIPAAFSVRTEGDTNAPAFTYVRNQSFLKVELGTNSVTEFQDASGRVYQPDEVGLLIMCATNGTSLTLTPAGIGASTTVTARNFRVNVSGGSAFLHHLYWTSSTSRQWSVNGGFAGQILTFTMGDLVPLNIYVVRKAGAVLTNVQSDSSGNLSFTDNVMSTFPVSYSIEAANATQPTSLRIRRSPPSSVIVSWPASGGWTLQQAAAISGQSWNDVSGGAVQVGSDYEYTVTNLTVRAYFRLRR